MWTSGALNESTPPTSHSTGGSNSFTPPTAPLLSSPLLNADVLLTSAYNCAKMFNFGSKFLLLFLLAFPFGLISIGKSIFFCVRSKRVSVTSLRQQLKSFTQLNILTWHRHVDITRWLCVFNATLPAWIDECFIHNCIRSSKKVVAQRFFYSEMNESGLPAACSCRLHIKTASFIS